MGSGVVNERNGSLYFKDSELACKCDGLCDKSQKMDKDLIESLDRVRDRFGRSISITSGYRCEGHNRNVGGSKDSYHMQGKAVDIFPTHGGITPQNLHELLDLVFYEGFGGILYYPSKGFLHLDVRPGEGVFKVIR